MVGNGIVSLTNPDEVFYAQTAKEMIHHNVWFTPYLFDAPQFEKPILTFWLLRISFMLFGISGFSARFFPSLFAILGVIATYVLTVTAYRDNEKAFLSSLVLMSCAIYIGLARTVFTDMIFSVFILFSLLSFLWGYFQQTKKNTGILLFFAFSGLAVLTKGPLGFLIPFLIVAAFLTIRKEIKFLFCKGILTGIFVFLLLSLPWYVYMIQKYGNAFITEFFYNDHLRRIVEAEHAGNDKWYFYPFSMVGGMFPWSIYFLAAFCYLLRHLRDRQNPIHLFLMCWIMVVFIMFQVAHSKLISYVFPLFPALSVVTGDFIYDCLKVKRRNLLFRILSTSTWLILLLIVIGSLFTFNKFSNYITSKTNIHVYLLVSFLYLLLTLYFIMSRRLSAYVKLLTLHVALLLYFILFSHSDLESYVSSKYSCEYLLSNHSVQNTILCSKVYLRGVRYYTDKEIAVIDVGGKKFFSPHPILYLDTAQKIGDFLQRQEITYCIFKKSSMEDIEDIIHDEFQVKVLKIIGNEYVLRISKTLGYRR
jgi:4-amino-4-deoxy-L-arabinose transferase-like glycosyltransferase